MNREPKLLAVSGVKNSGKTTLITRLIPFLRKEGYSIAVIKHDGHDFEADVPGTDSYKHKEAGAYGTAVFSGNRLQIVKEKKNTGETELIACFPEADIIFLEGFKDSSYLKIETVRKEISHTPVCRPDTVAAYVSDGDFSHGDIPVFGFEDISGLGTYLIQKVFGARG